MEKDEILIYFAVIIVIGTLAILTWQCKQYHDMAVTYKTLYETCNNATQLDWGNFLK